MPLLVRPHHHVVADVDHIAVKIDVPHLQGGDLPAPQRAGGGEHDADPQLGIIFRGGQRPRDRKDVRNIESGADLLRHADDRHPDLFGLENGGDKAGIVFDGLSLQAGARQLEDKHLHIIGADAVDTGAPEAGVFALELISHIFVTSKRGGAERRAAEQEKILCGVSESAGCAGDGPMLVYPCGGIGEHLALVEAGKRLTHWPPVSVCAGISQDAPCSGW